MVNNVSHAKQHIIDLRMRLAKWITPGAKDQDPMAANVSPLKSLSPQYEPDEHEGYVNLLVSELRKSGHDAPRNVALTGHYGSGKSSVLKETQNRLAKADTVVINLSLPSLGVGDGRTPQVGDKARDRTNLIQKEIVKQILYRRRPSDTPASRYNRLDTFNKRQAYRRAAVVGFIALILALLTRLPDRVEKSLPAASWRWIDDYIFAHASDLLQWLSLALAFVLVTWITVWLQRVLQQRFRITELGAGAGSTTVKLTEPTSSFFDEYLDEIIYFFQTSGTTVVIFEDLDRFKDPYIFETLRELNLLLNNAEQTGDEPIRFVYAIRDSIFEQLDSKPVVFNEEAKENVAGSGNKPDEARRLITTNRTKFFDLVIPMVPFISHRTSRNLMAMELASIPAEQRPGGDVIDIVSAHITDMRLIKNIRNEYEIFRTRILRTDGLDGLTPNKLFASIVYKNLYLADYEDIRNGRSLLDEVYRAFREWVDQQVEAQRAVERKARAELRRVDSIARRSQRLGTRLQTVIQSRIARQFPTAGISITVGGRTVTWSELGASDFWRSFVDERNDLSVVYNPTTYSPESVDLSFDNVEALIGETLNSSDWDERDRSSLAETVEAAHAKQLEYAHASLSFAILATDDEFTHEGKSKTLLAVAEEVFDGAQLVIDLLRTGEIDENFTLYVTQYPGDSSSVAMNFILKSVQPDVMDIEYHFGADDAVSEQDIKAVLSAERARILSGNSVYNRELFDYLLSRQPEALEVAINRLTNGTEQSRKFIDAYLSSGDLRRTFMQALSTVWSGTFTYLLQDPDSVGKLRAPEDVDLTLLDAALSGMSDTTNYEQSDEERALLNDLLTGLETVTKPQTQAASKRIAGALKKLGVAATDLSDVADPLRQGFIARSMYTINLGNLKAIVGNEKLPSLDVLRGHPQPTVYSFAIRNLSAYLDAVADEESIPTVLEQSAFASTLTDVSKSNAELVQEVAARASTDCTISDLGKLDSTLWPAVARAHRIKLTTETVATYIAEYDVDESIAEWLVEQGAIDATGEEAARLAVALRILTAERISSDAKLKIISSLDLTDESVDSAELTGDAAKLIPDLVSRGLIADDAAAFNAIGDDDSQTKQRLMVQSNEFPAYMTTLTLSAQDLNIMTWPGTPERVTLALFKNLDSLGQSLGEHGAAGIAQWAASTDQFMPLDQVELVASKAKPTATGAIIKLLSAHATTADIETIKRVLNSLGGGYAQLTAPGKDRPKLPAFPGLVAILDRLRSDGVVSKFSENSKDNIIRVSKHHS